MLNNKSIKIHSVALLIVGVLLIGLLVPMSIGMFITLGIEREKLSRELEEFQIETLEILVESTEDAMLSFSPEEVHNIVGILLKDERIVSINIFSEIYDLYLLQASKQTSGNKYDTIVMSELVLSGGEVLGYVEVAVDKEWVLPRIRQQHNHIMLLFGAMFFGVVMLVVPAIYYKILKPLNRLVMQAEGLSQGDFTTPSKWQGKDELSLLGRTLDDMRSKLDESFSAMQEMAVTDELTGLPNRRGFNAEVETLLQLSRRYRHPLALALLDLDNFKSINDTFGHAVGDVVLKSFAQKVCKRIRRTDLFVRVGGEEFVLVMPETSIAAAEMLLNDIRKVVGNEPFSHGEKVTVSIGVVGYSGNEDVKHLLEAADGALYEAKKEGRDRVVVHSPSSPA